MPRRAERELDDELAFHLERETHELLDQGLSPAEARSRALARFGPMPMAADECRDARGTAFVASDPSVLGRRLLVNGFSCEVIGVMPEGFRGLAAAPPDFWAPLSLLAQFRNIHAGREDAVGLGIVGRLRPGMSRQTALAGLAMWDAGQQPGGTIERRSTNITLVPRRGTIPQSAEAMLVFSPLFLSFGLILMIGCANVANLLLGRAVSRQREVGIRLSLRASRRRIIRQLLTESLLLALAAAAAGFAISRVVLEATIHALMTSMPPDLGDIRLWVPGADWRVVLFLVGGAVVSTALFGLAPALQATRVEPVRISEAR